jgi:hypothetical protein
VNRRSLFTIEKALRLQAFTSARVVQKATRAEPRIARAECAAHEIAAALRTRSCLAGLSALKLGGGVVRAYYRRLFWIGVSLCILIPLVVLFILYPYFPQILIEIRFALFSRLVPDTAVFEMPPPKLYASGFLRDDSGSIDLWRELARDELIQMRNLPADFSSSPTLNRAMILAQRNSGGARVSSFSDHDTLVDRLRGVPHGVGHCSDVAETFLALCSLNRIDAYEFSTTQHTIAAVYSPELSRWIAIDPQFCILMKDACGTYLSPAQLRSSIFAGTKVEFEFFGDPAWHAAHATSQALQYYDDPDDYRDYALTLGNNVFAVDHLRCALRSVPKPLRQLYYRAIGAMPEFAIVNDQYARRAARVPVLRRWVYLFSAMLTIMITPQLMVWTIDRMSAKRNAPRGETSAESELCGANSRAS